MKAIKRVSISYLISIITFFILIILSKLLNFQADARFFIIGIYINVTAVMTMLFLEADDDNKKP